MTYFVDPDERRLMEGFNAEVYKLYFQQIEVYKSSSTATYDDFYHEDINRTQPETYSYKCAGYLNVTDNGLANMYKGGVQIDKRLMVYFSRALLEETLRFEQLDIYDDIPKDGDVLKIQGVWFKIITVDPEGYHAGERYYPFDYALLVKPEAEKSITHSEGVRHRRE
jgi:hypothetical protein